MDKIKRIHSFFADSISKMTYEDIQHIIDNIPFDYSIHIETQFCEPSSQSDKKNSDLSHITISDTFTESQVPNESVPKKFDTKVEVIPPIS
ncbi:11843_t:CDS:1, partial [Ambispora gerdemannii]